VCAGPSRRGGRVGWHLAQPLDDRARLGERLGDQLGIGDPLGDTARKQIDVAAPGVQRRLLARRGNIGVVKPDRRGITAFARSVVLVGKDPSDEAMRVMAHVKMNIAASGPSFGFSLAGAFGARSSRRS